MPRERFDDATTDGLYVQLNWRRAVPADAGPDDPDYEGGSPGHLQISTHDERADARVRELVNSAAELIGALTSAVLSGERMSDELEGMRRAWVDALTRYRPELTGSYTSLDRSTALSLVRNLHRSIRQVWPPTERVSTVMDGVPLFASTLGAIPANPPQEPPPDPPGATGYRLS